MDDMVRLGGHVDDERMALVARALAHPARVRIIKLLASHPECAGSEVFAELPLAQSTISQHLRVLKDAGVLASHSVGSGSVYCLVPGLVDDFLSALGEICAGAPECGSGADPR
jgi:ArsR family transcriptional regulator, arsenate/arsenite/antimonite-responsive transcriptional repressor